ncbi:MAG: Holliday junction resolvase-like protein [Candidatus Hodarchaeota archaeon]
MDVLTIALTVIIIILGLFVVFLFRERGLIRREIEIRAEKRFMEMEAQLREDVLRRSRASLKGRIAEQMIPFLAEFKYNPADARFIGSPIDYVIFDGYTDVKDSKIDRPITVVLMDIKTGDAALTSEQRKIRQALEQRRIRWETIKLRR